MLSTELISHTRSHLDRIDANLDLRCQFNFVVDQSTFRESRECTILHLAAQNGYTKLVEAIIDAIPNADTIFVLDRFQRIPIHYAIGSGKIDCVEQILTQTRSKFGDCYVIKMLMDSGALYDLPIHFAIVKGNAPIVRLLLSCFDWRPMPLFCFCVEKGDTPLILETLICSGMERFGFEWMKKQFATTYFGFPLIGNCTRYGRIQSIEMLLKYGQYFGVDIDGVDYFLKTSLRVAISLNQWACANILLALGADVGLLTTTKLARLRKYTSPLTEKEIYRIRQPVFFNASLTERLLFHLEPC